MIDTYCVKILNNDSYDKLRQVIPPTHIDDFIISELKKNLGTKCKSVVVENPYYDGDYLSTYYIFYSKKLRQFPKECWRLLFCTDATGKHVFGSMSLRPTYDRVRIGRTLINPSFLVDKPSDMILCPQKVHSAGREIMLRVFPHMRQEGDVSVCAHVALWAILRSFSARFNLYRDVKLGEIVEAIEPESERLIPSKGLSVFQISDALLKYGFSPIICSEADDRSRTQGCADSIITYVNSGIPVLGISSSRNHAVAIVGKVSVSRDDQSKVWDKPPVTCCSVGSNKVIRLLFSSDFVSDYIVNDDNFFPYQRVNRYPQKSQTNCVQYDKEDHPSIVNYKIRDFDYAIIPLYSRVQLCYSDVKELLIGLVEAGNYDDIADQLLVVHPFLASANTYREYANDVIRQYDSDLSELILTIEMPKFIWCVEIATKESFQKGLFNALVLIDSTSATVNKEPYLLVTDEREIRYLDRDVGRAFPQESGRKEFPSFDRNLNEVQPNV